ncbi:MAG: hypothetical protein II581_01025, partial [Oscillospiraceae bacterium]|nr:hypothetical protein [Oscillospiraceae bacterium]
ISPASAAENGRIKKSSEQRAPHFQPLRAAKSEGMQIGISRFPEECRIGDSSDRAVPDVLLYVVFVFFRFQSVCT